MPKFFVPLAKDTAEAETDYHAIRRVVGEQASGPLEDSRIFRIDYNHHGKRRRAQVGERERHEGAIVHAILKQRDCRLYFICTPDRGVVRGGPICVGDDEVIRAVEFDPA
jgi:hypothetical protein